jgi:hypothetical protein
MTGRGLSMLKMRWRGLLGLMLCLPGLAAVAEEDRVRGQLLYVPVYSEVPYGDKRFTLNLTATLSVRNPDQNNPVTLKRVDYYSAAGERVRAYLNQPLTLKPMASTEFIVRESDRSGGISASFLVEWDSAAPVARPFVEAIMVNSTYNQGIAFNSGARTLEERR